jgi:glyoxylase-like metal-dependent hydrolase (beta-lactamase superfamily II)
LLTHGHFDHVGAVRAIAAETGCPVYLCAEDLSMPPQMTAGPLYYTHTYQEGDVVNLAGVSVRVLHTPGHTPGSVCLMCEDTIFSGDTLFQDSCGRTDLPGGNWATILQSLKRLANLDGDFTVYPGHGPATTLEEEKRWNPYMRG